MDRYRLKALYPLKALCLLMALTACDSSAPDADPSAPTLEARSEANEPFELEHRPEWATDHPILSPNAKIETHQLLLEEKGLVKSPGDGGGRMWLERVVPVDTTSGEKAWTPDGEDSKPPSLLASSSHRFELVYEVGEHGIDEGGLIFIHPEPFWDWSPSQTESPEISGFTTAIPRQQDVELEPSGFMGSFEVKGRSLVTGERIDIVYGAGPTGARVDRYAQHDAEILVAVDADADGLRAWSKATPRLDISAREASMIVAFAPADVAPGQRFEVQVAALDAIGSRSRWPEPNGEPEGRDVATGFDLRRSQTSTAGTESITSRLESPGEDLDIYRFSLEAPLEPGTLRLEVRGRGAYEGFESDVNPILVRESATRLYWADLHGHSSFSDGTGNSNDYFAYARDVARLDAAALTDHDHWGLRPLDETPEHAEQIRRDTAAFHEPGRFVTVPGYEWTSWIHGHRHVLYFDASNHEAHIHSSIDPATDRPDELWKALEGQAALTFAHHSVGDPIATNWYYRPDPILEPVTEITSVHGMSEAADALLPVQGAISGYFVRDTLLRGDRLGFIGSGDSHDGHPGLVHLANPTDQGGLAGIFATGLDRESLLEALRKRRTFATNGIRAWLEVTIDDSVMGEDLPPDAQTRETQQLRVRFEATAPIERIDLIRSGIVASLPGDLGLSLDFVREIPTLGRGEFHYVRIQQSDGGVAWSSPIYAEPRAEIEAEPDSAHD